MGFCLVNNVVVAARYAQTELGLERVAILDWDVHHGNGTEAIVRGDESIFFVSLHQWPFYPGTGGPDDDEREHPQRPSCRRLRRLGVRGGVREIVEPAVAGFEPDLCWSRPASTPTRTIPWPTWS